MRRFERSIKYNGINISKDVAGMVTSLSYTESISGEADAISLELADRDDQWLNDWAPTEGDSIALEINLHDWLKVGDQSSLDLGLFYIDTPSFSGNPTKVSLEGISRKTNDGFAKTKKTRTWEQATIMTICQKICGEYGLELHFDADDFELFHTEQDDSDMSFLYSLIDKYGLKMKLFQTKLIVLDPERYESNAPVKTIKRTADIVLSWSLSPDWNESNYTSCEINYQTPLNGNTILYKYSLEKDDGNQLVIDEAVSSIQEAERITKSSLRKALRSKITGSITLMGSPELVATQNITLSGFGVFDGIYSIEKSSHSFDSKYETVIDIYKIDYSLGTGRVTEKIKVKEVNTNESEVKSNAGVSQERQDYRDKLSEWSSQGIILE